MGALNTEALGAAAAPNDATAAAPALRPPLPLALLEVVDRDGQVRQAWRVEHWPLTIGRALDNDIVLSEPHVAPHHASLWISAETPPRVEIDVGTTVNGIVVGQIHLASGQSRRFAADGGELELHVGRTTLRLRLATQALASEQPLYAAHRREPGWRPTAALALGVLAAIVFNAWLRADPEGTGPAVGNAVLGALVGGALWCAFWSLLSKTFVRRGHVAWHLRVCLAGGAALLAIGAAAPALAFAFSWPWLTDFSFVAAYASVAVALYFHLLAVEPAQHRLFRGVVASGFVAAVAVAVWFNIQRTSRPGDELYMSHLLPPQLRAARPVAVDNFVARLAPLQAILDRQAKVKDDGSGNEVETDE
ncbi:MAG: FHA domain-containing protein [Pseudomonadota bacterium]|nr:FHA domain-containing protein [Pseudomonadota bacterium]